ncbi:hypothetical protein E2C01_086288 [Portunus trituberculatus]|uniref:Uncharacterized protein n=1 Tax=Portunus trituberculatus TaxID=210409 RepID=A0A5B7JFY6_PORTR|nr:hypothetical protein [Portunus trituberculatus]
MNHSETQRKTARKRCPHQLAGGTSHNVSLASLQQVVSATFGAVCHLRHLVRLCHTLEDNTDLPAALLTEVER